MKKDLTNAIYICIQVMLYCSNKIFLGEKNFALVGPNMCDSQIMSLIV